MNQAHVWDASAVSALTVKYGALRSFGGDVLQVLYAWAGPRVLMTVRMASAPANAGGQSSTSS